MGHGGHAAGYSPLNVSTQTYASMGFTEAQKREFQATGKEIENARELNDYGFNAVASVNAAKEGVDLAGEFTHITPETTVGAMLEQYRGDPDKWQEECDNLVERMNNGESPKQVLGTTQPASTPGAVSDMVAKEGVDPFTSMGMERLYNALLNTKTPGESDAILDKLDRVLEFADKDDPQWIDAAQSVVDTLPALVPDARHKQFTIGDIQRAIEYRKNLAEALANEQVEIDRVGAQLHGVWQEEFKAQNGDVERWKPAGDPEFEARFSDLQPGESTKTDPSLSVDNVRCNQDGEVEIDITHSPYDQLSSKWKKENHDAGAVAVGIAYDTLRSGQRTISEEEASVKIHDEWLKRNPWEKDGPLGKPYAELTEGEKEKDRNHIRLATQGINGRYFKDSPRYQLHREMAPEHPGEKMGRASVAGKKPDAKKASSKKPARKANPAGASKYAENWITNGIKKPPTDKDIQRTKSTVKEMAPSEINAAMKRVDQILIGTRKSKGKSREMAEKMWDILDAEKKRRKK